MTTRSVRLVLTLVALLLAAAQPAVAPAFAATDTPLSPLPAPASGAPRRAAAGPYEQVMIFAPDIELPPAPGRRSRSTRTPK